MKVVKRFTEGENIQLDTDVTGTSEKPVGSQNPQMVTAPGVADSVKVEGGESTPQSKEIASELNKKEVSDISNIADGGANPPQAVEPTENTGVIKEDETMNMVSGEVAAAEPKFVVYMGSPRAIINDNGDTLEVLMDPETGETATITKGQIEGMFESNKNKKVSMKKNYIPIEETVRIIAEEGEFYLDPGDSFKLFEAEDEGSEEDKKEDKAEKKEEAKKMKEEGNMDSEEDEKKDSSVAAVAENEDNDEDDKKVEEAEGDEEEKKDDEKKDVKESKKVKYVKIPILESIKIKGSKGFDYILSEGEEIIVPMDEDSTDPDPFDLKFELADVDNTLKEEEDEKEDEKKDDEVKEDAVMDKKMAAIRAKKESEDSDEDDKKVEENDDSDEDDKVKESFNDNSDDYKKGYNDYKINGTPWKKDNEEYMKGWNDKEKIELQKEESEDSDENDKKVEEKVITLKKSALVNGKVIKAGTKIKVK